MSTIRLEMNNFLSFCTVRHEPFCFCKLHYCVISFLVLLCSKLSVEYLYSLGVAPSNMIKLEYLENNMNFFCNIANMASVCQRKTRSSVSPKLKKDNSQTLCSLEDNSTDVAELHSLLVKLAASNSVMVSF